LVHFGGVLFAFFGELVCGCAIAALVCLSRLVMSLAEALPVMGAQCCSPGGRKEESGTDSVKTGASFRGFLARKIAKSVIFSLCIVVCRVIEG
jgi:hypothetical protein